MSRYSVGTGNPNGGAAGRRHKRPKEPRGESTGPSPRPGGPAQRDIFAHLTTAVGSSGKDPSLRIDRGATTERLTRSFASSHSHFPSSSTTCTLLIALFFQTSPHSAVTVAQPQSSYPGLTPTPDTDGSIKIERLPVTNASKF